MQARVAAQVSALAMQQESRLLRHTQCYVGPCSASRIGATGSLVGVRVVRHLGLRLKGVEQAPQQRVALGVGAAVERGDDPYFRPPWQPPPTALSLACPGGGPWLLA